MRRYSWSAKFISENKKKMKLLLHLNLLRNLQTSDFKNNVEDDKKMLRGLIMGLKAEHPEFKKDKYIMGCILRLKTNLQLYIKA